MNGDQIASTIRAMMMMLSGYALAHGFTPDTWASVVAGVGAMVTWGWSLSVHKDAAPVVKK